MTLSLIDGILPVLALALGTAALLWLGIAARGLGLHRILAAAVAAALAGEGIKLLGAFASLAALAATSFGATSMSPSAATCFLFFGLRSVSASS